MQRESWLAVVQDGDVAQETEVVTLEGVHGEAGGTIEISDGRRITLTVPADEVPDDQAAA